ncbi:MAG: monovalent cation/H+ antiporter complex subunit F [Planctomycetota bacterium]|jgi:multicomponent Na+:H+ antiporter subunit F
MEIFLIAFGLGLLFTMLITLYRVIFGPTTYDRIMGVNVIGTKTTVLLVIIGTIYNRVDMFVDIALAYAMLNFITTLAASKFFQHRKKIGADAPPPAGANGGGP